MFRFILTGLVIISVSVSASVVAADDKPEPPGIGDSVPAWSDLKATNDKSYSLADWKGKVVVVCFTCNTCLYSVDYEDRLNQLQKKYVANKDVKIVAINSNAIAADSLEKMAERAKEKEFGFPYIKDESQDVAKAWGAIYTPEFFVVDRNHKLIYKGAMDDSTKADAVKVKYVELAIEAALKNEQPEVAKVGARGCAIRFPRRRRKRD